MKTEDTMKPQIPRKDSQENDNATKSREADNSHSPCDDCLGSSPGNCSPFEEEGKVDRAQFVRTALCGVAILWGGMTLFPIYLYLNPKPGGEEAKTKVTSLEVCKLKEIPKGSGRNFRFGSTPALLIHTQDGEVHAFKAICSHLGCTVQYRGDKDAIWCACHGGAYDAHTGRNIAGPPPKPLAALKVDVVDGTVIVSQA